MFIICFFHQKKEEEKEAEGGEEKEGTKGGRGIVIYLIKNMEKAIYAQAQST